MEPSHQPQDNDRGNGQDFPSLIRDIAADSKKLLRQEWRLAMAEIKEDLVRGKNAAALFAGAAGCFVFAMALVVLALVEGMVSVGIPRWAADTLFSALFVVVATSCYFLGKRWVGAIHGTPRETLTDIKENVTWIKTRL